MFVYLYVRHIDFYGKITAGTLEIARKRFPGQTTQVFEWRGENGSSDGGTWDWNHNQYGFVAMVLTSNNSGGFVGELTAHDHWGKSPLPPLEPWFKYGVRGGFRYVLPTGKELFCEWWLK